MKVLIELDITQPYNGVDPDLKRVKAVLDNSTAMEALSEGLRATVTGRVVGLPRKTVIRTAY